MTLLERLLRRLALAEKHTDVFLGGSGEGGVTANARLFGGLVAAQATMAALNTVAQEFSLHSLHAYFLRPARAEADIEFHVTRNKDGHNFAVRSVSAWQSEQLIFQLQCSFQRPEQGVYHAPPMPVVEPPTKLPNRDQLKGRSNWQDMPIDVRMVTEITGSQAQAAEQRIWMKANGVLPEDPHIHLALVVYASDRSLLDTAWRPHAHEGIHTGASLDHSMWFHQPPRFDDWLLYDTHSANAAGARGLAFGHIFNKQGQCLVSTAQEGVLRFR